MAPPIDNDQNGREPGNVTSSEPKRFSDLLDVPRNTASAIELHLTALWDDCSTITDFVSRTRETINFGQESSLIFAGYLMGRFVERNELLTESQRVTNAMLAGLEEFITQDTTTEE